jgi:hypothetical protein
MVTWAGRKIAAAAAVATIIGALAAPGAEAAVITATWTGGNGNWTETPRWSFSPASAVTWPSNNFGPDSFNVFIDGGSAGASVVRLNTTVAIDTLTISSGDTLINNNNQDMTVATGSVVNNGTFNLAAVSAATDLRMNGASSIGGTGTMALSDSTLNRILTGAAGDVVTHGAGHTIRGAGQILLDSGGMINDGTIDADAAVNALVIDAGAPGFVNNGTLRASGAAGLSVDATGNNFTQAGTATVNAGSRMVVSAGDYVQTGGQTTVDGTLQVEGAGASVDIGGGRLGGGGVIRFTGGGAQAVNNTAGTLAAGDSPGILTIENAAYAQSAGGVFEYELSGAAPGAGGHDLLVVDTGVADLAGLLDIILDPSFAASLTLGDQFEVIRLINGGSFLGGNEADQLFDAVAVDLAGFAFDQFISGSSLFVSVARVADVPVPASALLLVPGLLALVFLRRRG